MIRLQSSRPAVGVVHEDKRSSRRCSCSAGLAESNEHWKAELAFPIGVYPCSSVSQVLLFFALSRYHLISVFVDTIGSCA